MGDLELDKGDNIEDYYDASIQWEYWDLSSQSWEPYPRAINRSIEGMHEMGMSPRYMYRPGDKEAAGVEEREIVARNRAPRGVASNHIYYSHMIDHQIYSGCGRRIRRREV